MKMNGLFINCVGKLIINLVGWGVKTDTRMISCAEKKKIQPSKCIGNKKVNPTLPGHKYNLSVKVNFLRLETRKLQKKDI